MPPVLTLNVLKEMRSLSANATYIKLSQITVLEVFVDFSRINRWIGKTSYKQTSTLATTTVNCNGLWREGKITKIIRFRN